LNAMIICHLNKAAARPDDAQIARGVATIPLSGIDVPFHSTYLRPGVATYRQFLQARIKVEDIQVEKLVDKFIPNVIGRPFQLDEKFLKNVWEITNSAVLGEILEGK
jgi:fatty acid synthase subunit beta, fungi type